MVNGSIINRTKLPDVLSDLEFNCYFKQFLEGNYDVLDILVSHNLRLVYWYIESNINCENLEYDEVFAVGTEALISAFYSFDPDKNIKFSTYATICIRNKILKYIRSENRYDKVMSLDQLISDSYNVDTFNELVIDEDVSMEENLLEKDLNDYLNKNIRVILEDLNEVDRKIVMLYFGFYDGRLYLQKEICEMLGISQSQVSRKLSRILKRVKELLETSLDYGVSDRELLIKKLA